MTLNCQGSLIDLTIPKVMGILNVTPDSFFDGGTLVSEKSLLVKVAYMLSEGATFLDVGGYSSRPGASHITEKEELDRVIPAIEAIVKQFPEAKISIDTFRSEVAKRCIEAGACMVNDISAGDLDPNMIPTIADLKVPYIMMHMKGTPKDMKQMASYQNVTQEVVFTLSKKLAEGRSLGINDLIVDPGFGFAKTREHNFEMLGHLEQFSFLEVPLLVGLSRKSMIYKTLETSPEEALNGSTVLHTIALLKGANILRVHDVKEAMECVKLLQNFKN
jgi:dihydropteroate synthase